MGGYLYIFQEGTNDLYKCGITENNPDVRRTQLQTGNPRRLNKIAYYRLRHYKQVETLVHHRLKTYSTEGGTEWFHCPLDTVLDTVKGAVLEIEHKQLSGVFMMFQSLRLTVLSLYVKGTKTLRGMLKLLAFIWTVFLLIILVGLSGGLVGLQFYF